MKPSIFSIFILLTVLSTLSFGLPARVELSDCSKCKLPDCRCWNDKSPPGHTPVEFIPQLILLTFDYAVSPATAELFLQTFEGIMNPNGCTAKGTYFVQKDNTNITSTRTLYKRGHELGLNSQRGVIPNTKDEWIFSLTEALKVCQAAGVPKEEIKGVRAPQLFAGGNDQYEAMRELGLKYDVSCVTVDYSSPEKLLWPFSQDMVKGTPICSIGHTVNRTFPGMWSFPVPVLDFKKWQCPSPSGCIPEINSTDNVFQLFFDAFDRHYQTGRTPFTIDIDTLWETENYRMTGTKEFLEVVNTYPGTYIVRMQDALKWIMDPKGTDMSTFGCSDEEIRKRHR